METKLPLSEALTQLRHPLARHVLERKAVAQLNPELITPWLRACRVRVLLVTDGGLDFGMGDFGLSAFINLLQDDDRFYVKFDITLAHLRHAVNAEQMGSGLTGIVNRITNFRFDEPAHFTPTMYDQVWLFGIETQYHQVNGFTVNYAHRNANRGTYPNDRLSNAELTNLNTFMQAGGGVFATGDHGALGRALCGAVTRVRSMRHWNSFTVNGQDEVSMTGPRRNDTNQIGHDAGSRFSDQSDDVPQTIQPRYYRSRINGHLQARYPHPLLCSRFGVINVMPDHPHEGECMVPTDLGQTYPFGGTAEYPPSTADGTPLSPEIVATSMVVAGNTSQIFTNTPKSATSAHAFGGICAYDGHRAGVGRVVTDATWHHFVNVNLIGVFEGRGFDDLDDVTPDHFSKHDGFMATIAGRAHLDKIKEYFVNIGVWISSPAKISCFNSRFWPKIIYSDRIMEAALVNPDVAISRISPDLFYSIGVHARDVLGRRAGQCQSLKFILDIFYEYVPRLIPEIDPWHPFPEPEFDNLIPRFDPTPMLDVALGYVIVSLRQAQPYAPEKIDEEFEATISKLAAERATDGLKLALTHFQKEQASFTKLLDYTTRQLKK